MNPIQSVSPACIPSRRHIGNLLLQRLLPGLLLASLLMPLPVLPDTTLRRTTLLVSDIERSIEFYEALGLKRSYDVSRDASHPTGILGGSDLPLAVQPQQSRIVILSGPHDDTGMIGLLAYDEPPLPRRAEPTSDTQRGDVILMLYLDDLHGVYQRLQELGTRMHLPPYRYEVHDQAGALRSAGWRMFLYDPDGHLLELAQPD